MSAPPNGAPLATAAPPLTAAQWVCRHVLLDLLSEADGFNQLLRKLVLLSNATISPVAVAYVGYHVWLAAASGWTAAHSLWIAILLYLSVIMTAPFLYMRFCAPSTTISDNVVDFALGSIITVDALCCACSSFNPLTCLAGMAFVTALVSTPRMPGILALALVLALLCCWNLAAIVTREVEPTMLPGVRWDGFVAQVLNGVAGIFVVALPVLMCVLQARKFKAMLADAEEAARLSRRVARHLQDYDTGAVERELARYRGEVARPDPELLQTYAQLVANLNRYRPHLPNWMVTSPADDDADSPCNAGAPQGDALVNVLQDGAANEGPPTANRRVSLGLDALMHVDRVASDVACALVDFSASDAPSSQMLAGVVSGFVDKVHDLASSLQGALHTFVGDTVHVSWNAAMEAPQPEAKAARFLCKLKEFTDNETLPGLSVAGAAVSGAAFSQFGGSGRVSAFVLSLPWRAKLLACFALAKRHRAFVCSAAVASAVGREVLTRPVELLSVRVHGAEDVVLVHELVGLRRHADIDDDWMYRLAASGHRSDMMGPLELCAEGYFSDALEALGAAAASDTRLVANLRARAQAAQQRPPRTAAEMQLHTFAMRICTCGDT
jgi:hypothetical protein